MPKGLSPLARCLCVAALAAVSGCAGAHADVAAVGDAAAASAVVAPAPSTRVDAGERPAAPALAGRTLDGGRLELAAKRDKIVVLDVMASWCQTCVFILPRWRTLAKRFAADVEVVVVSEDEEVADMAALAKRASIDHRVVLDGDETWFRALELSVVPTAVVIDRRGRIAGVFRELADGGFERLEALLEAEVAADGGR
jgi:cytochrome c biogenesis protein CcmG/thiol:disulfide interchange protein DsbE